MNSIQEKFQELREDYSVANVIRYTDYLESCSKSDIIDCFENTFVEPIKGGEFTKKFILLNSFTENELGMMKASMESFVNNAETNLYDNYEHVEAVKECIQLIDAKLEHVTHISMVDLMLESMYLSEMEITCEGAQIADELLKKIISNDISDDVKTKYANKLIAKIKAGEVPLNTIKGANIIISTTAAIIYYATVIPLSVISLMLPIPVLMVSSAINKGLSKANYKICKRILESEIRKVEVAQSTNDMSDALMTYLQNLQQARELLISQGNFTLESTLVELDEQETLSDKVKILDMAISENFIKFAFSEDETVEESIQWFNNIVALTNTKNLIVEQFVHEMTMFESIKFSSDVQKIVARHNFSVNTVRSDVKKLTSQAKTPEEVTTIKNTYDYLKGELKHPHIHPSKLYTSSLDVTTFRKDEAQELLAWLSGDEYKSIINKAMKRVGGTVKESAFNEFFDELEDELDEFDE